MLNDITLQGRLVRDPEMRKTQNDIAVTTFTIAVDRDFGQKEADFVDCVAWRNGAEFINQYFQKGRMIIVCGRLQSRKYQDRNGNDRTAWEVNVDQAYFGDSAKANGNSQAQETRRQDAPQRRQREKEETYEQPTHFVIDDEDPDLPF